MSSSEQSDGNSLAAEVIELLVQREQTLAVAESSTGGLIGHLLTEVAGASRAFLGGVIAYHDRLKEQLGVPRALLEGEGAVSSRTAEAMAEGVRRHTGADIGLAVTGIAGPTGGTEGKPVGLTYVALAAEGSRLGERHVWTGGRTQNKEASTCAGLAMLKRYLQSRS